MKMILFVMHDPAKLADLLEAWKNAGVSGATVLFSTGLGRLVGRSALQEELPLMPSLEDFLPKPEKMSRTIFSVIPDEETLQRVISATRQVVGDLSQPDTGMLIVLPVSQVEGMPKNIS